MKFFDFLQDVTFVGVLLGVSSFLIDGSRDLVPSADAAPLTLGSVGDAVDIDTIEVDDFLRDGNTPSEPMLPDAADDWATGSSAPLLDVPNASPASPAPLDLDMLDRVLSDKLGLRRDDIQKTPPVEPQTVMPAPADAVERVFSVPAPPSRPIAGVNRTFDDANLFEQEFGVADDVDSPSLQTRRLGPVDYLSAPIDEF